MTPALSSADLHFMQGLPKRDVVPQAMKGASAVLLDQLARVARLRKLALISVALDWDMSDAALVSRDIALTDAGLQALAAAREAEQRP
jgi:hypothetical protein